MSVAAAICIYNRADCLADAVGSVMVREALFPFEVMAIDNNSTDGGLVLREGDVYP